MEAQARVRVCMPYFPIARILTLRFSCAFSSFLVG